MNTVTVKRETQALAPGSEPEHIKLTLENFLSVLDGAFPGKRIVWREWDHARFDKLASYLCSELGYSAGAPFLTAYGYTVVTDDNIFRPEAETEDEPENGTAETTLELVQEEAPAPGQETETEAQPAEENTAPDKLSAVHTGRIVRVFGNKNSGFIRDDASGDDYYFNIRSFTRWVDTLTPGRAVSFRLARHFDSRHNRMRENAVELSYVESRQTYK